MSDRIDDFLERIKGQQPCIEDADSVTDAVMAHIAAESVAKRESVVRRPVFGTLLQAALSAAAVVAFGLFVAGWGVEPIEENRALFAKNGRALDLTGVEQCRSTTDFCAIYFERTRARRNAGYDISTLKNLYYASKK